MEEEEGGGNRYALDRYPYLKHLNQSWLGDWVKHMTKMNEAVGMKNRVMIDAGGKKLVYPFKRQEFWKCIGCILSEVNYGKKLHKLWS